MIGAPGGCISLYAVLVAVAIFCFGSDHWLARAQGREGSTCPLSHLTVSEDSIYSQNGEDGVLLRILEAIGTTNRKYLEFGVEDGMQCNTRVLRERCNFTGLMWDGSNENIGINLRSENITTANVVDLFLKYNVDYNLDVMSIDVDMFDWWILLRVLRRGYRPRVLIVEVNPTLGVSDPKLRHEYHRVNSVPLVVIPPEMTHQETWDLSRYAGANPLAFFFLVSEFGYNMVHCDVCGVNCFFVRRDAMPASCAATQFALPKYSYPCYATTLTGGAYPGHIIDFNYQPAVRLSFDLLANIVVGGYSLFDVARYLHEPSPEYTSWGRDVCSFIYDDFATVDMFSVERTKEFYVSFAKGIYEFKGRNFENAKNFFVSSLNIFADDAANECIGNSWSVMNCRIRAIILYNIAMSYLNSRAPNRLAEVSRILNDAASYVRPSSKYLNRIQFYSEFLTRLTDPNLQRSFVFASIPLRRSVPTLAPVALTLCTDETTAFNAICKKHNIAPADCVTITSSMRDAFKTHIINYPNAYLNRNNKDLAPFSNWLQEFVPDIGAPYRDGGCMGDVMASFEALKQSICRVPTHSLVSVFGLGGRNLLNAIGQKIVSGGKMVFGETARSIDRLAMGLVHFTNQTACSPAFYTQLDPAECSGDILRQIHIEELSDNIEVSKDLLMQLYIETFGSVFNQVSNRDDIFGMIVANPMAPFIRSSMMTIFGQLFSQFYNIIVVPPLQIAIASLAKERNVDVDTALSLIIEHTNRLIEANKQTRFEDVLLLTYSEAENLNDLTAIFGSDVVESMNSALFEVVGPQSETTVKAPIWFYNCYETIRLNRKFPDEICSPDMYF